MPEETMNELEEEQEVQGRTIEGFALDEAERIQGVYVCSQCESELTIFPEFIQSDDDEERFVVVCPQHGNIELVGAVSKTTVAIRNEWGLVHFREYCRNHSDYWGCLMDRPSIIREEISHLNFELKVFEANDTSTPRGRMLVDKIKELQHILKHDGEIRKKINLAEMGFGSSAQISYLKEQLIEKESDMPVAKYTNTPKTALLLGRIHKGAPRSDEGNVGKDLDHFRITFLENKRNIGGQTVKIGELLERRFREVYGEKPDALNIKLPNQSLVENFDIYYECYKGGVMYWKAGSRMVGDQEVVYWEFYRDEKTGITRISGGVARDEEGRRLLAQPIDLSQPMYYGKSKDGKPKPYYLEERGRLKVIIEELVDVGDMIVVGYFEFCPESPRDLRSISGELNYYDALVRQFGVGIHGVPMVLLRRKEQVSKRIGDKMTVGDSYPVHISLRGEWGSRALKAVELLSLPDVVDGEELPPQLEEGEPVEPQGIQGRNAPQPIEEGWDEEAFEAGDEPKQARILAKFPSGVQVTPQILVDAKLAENVPAAAKIINLLGLAGKKTDQAIPKVYLYCDWIETGLDAKTAASKTIAGELPPA